MIPDRQKSIAAMRTFARDLEHDRGDSPAKEKMSTPHEVEKEVVPTIPKSAPKMAAAKATHNNVAHTNISANVPEHIPAFHELKKDKPVIKEKIEIKEEKKKDKHEKKARGITTKTPKGGGTIITDTKHERRPFFKELSTSLSSWFLNFKKSFKKAGKKTYTVTDTTRRKGVVQKATSKTGTMFSADNETLMNEIRKRQRAEKSPTEDGEEEILWSPYTESGYPLLDGEVKSFAPKIPEKPKAVPPVQQIQNVSVQPRKRALPELVATKPTTETPPLIDEEIVRALEQEPIAVEELPKTRLQEAPEIAEEEIPEVEEVEEEFIPEEPEFKEPFINGPWWDPRSFFHHDTNKLTVAVFGALAVVVFGVFAAVTIFGNSAIEIPIEQVVVHSPISSDSAALTQVTLDNTSYNEMSTKLNLAMLETSPGALVEFMFVNGQDVSVSPQALSTIIDMREGDVFSQTLTELRVLKNTDGSRAVLFKVEDNLNARGGLLDWELFMYEDIALLLDEKYKEELAAAFYDVTFGNQDLRVLKDGDEVLLVYGFIDAKTVVITSSLDAFITVTEL